MIVDQVAPRSQRRGFLSPALSQTTDEQFVDGVPPAISILLAVDENALRSRLVAAIRDASELTLAGTTGDARTAIAMVGTAKPHVVLLGLFDYTGGVGELVTQMLLRLPAVRIVLLSREALSETTIDLVRHGVRGVLAHDRADHLLASTVRAVMAGQYWIRRSVIGDIVRTLNEKQAATAMLEPALRAFALTPTELAIAELVATGCSNEHIATQRRITPSTVKHHLTSIFHKTGASSRVELALLAMPRRGTGSA